MNAFVICTTKKHESHTCSETLCAKLVPDNHFSPEHEHRSVHLLTQSDDRPKPKNDPVHWIDTQTSKCLKNIEGPRRPPKDSDTFRKTPTGPEGEPRGAPRDPGDLETPKETSRKPGKPKMSRSPKRMRDLPDEPDALEAPVIRHSRDGAPALTVHVHVNHDVYV